MQIDVKTKATSYIHSIVLPHRCSNPAAKLAMGTRTPRPFIACGTASMLRRRVRFAEVLAPTLRRDGSDGWDRPLFQFCRLEEDRDHHQSQDAESNGCVSTPIFGIRPPSTGRTPHVLEPSCMVPVSASHVACFPSKLSHARVESNGRFAQAAARASRAHGSETQCVQPRPPFHALLHVLPSTPRKVQETPPSRAAKLAQARRRRARFDGTFSMRRHVRSNGFEPERSSD